MRRIYASLQAPTGGAMRLGPCCSASMALHGKQKSRFAECLAVAFCTGVHEQLSLSQLACSTWPGSPSPAATCFQLIAYHRFNEEAALRDHRRLGQELDLFR